MELLPQLKMPILDYTPILLLVENMFKRRNKLARAPSVSAATILMSAKMIRLENKNRSKDYIILSVFIIIHGFKYIIAFASGSINGNKILIVCI